jgi:hypothetical protein
MQPLVSVLVLLAAGFAAHVFFRPESPMFRRFKPDHLMKSLSEHFTGIIPVLAIREQLAHNLHPLWRPQTPPSDVFMKAKVDGKPLLVLGDDNKKVLDRERTALWFAGDTGKRTKDGRIVSRMLGIQLVDFNDPNMGRVCYPDRMSPAGRVVYALFAAYAFGGEEGKADFNKASDALNRSTLGSKTGVPNLEVAQWIFDKYRTNKAAHAIFALHNWEYTALYELLRQAKRQGKAGHWNILWLKPTNRIMFYVINTVGRYTPHTESAAAFNQLAFERKAARMGRLPVKRDPVTGRFTPSVFVMGAVEGLMLEYQRWMEAGPNDEDWWRDDRIWKRAQASVLQNFKDISAANAASSHQQQQDTEFDRVSKLAIDAADKRQRDQERASIASQLEEVGARNEDDDF